MGVDYHEHVEQPTYRMTSIENFFTSFLPRFTESFTTARFSPLHLWSQRMDLGKGGKL